MSDDRALAEGPGRDLMSASVYGAGHIKRDRASRDDMDARYEAIFNIVRDNQPTGIRFTYYTATTRGIVPKTDDGYRKVQRAVLQMRRAGLIPYEWITDSTRWMRKPRTYNSLEDAIESTAKMRRLQFEGEEAARTMQKKAARRAAEAGDMPALMAAGQSVTQEAMERSMAYWGQMFELVVEIQKRLFTLMESQMADVPGVKQAKAALAMMPDMTQMQNVVSAMKGVMSSGGSAFESMQKVMGDFARMSGMKR